MVICSAYCAIPALSRFLVKGGAGGWGPREGSALVAKVVATKLQDAIKDSQGTYLEKDAAKAKKAARSSGNGG